LSRKFPRSLRKLIRNTRATGSRWLHRGQDNPFIMSRSEVARLEKLPPKTLTTTKISGIEIVLTDPFWFLHMYDELLLNQIYRYRATCPSPYIIDCGANIGISVIFFKTLYPEARVIAFEPDAMLFEVLNRNIAAFSFVDVETLNEAVWDSDAILSFKPDGSVGGRVVEEKDETKDIEVQSRRLAPFLEDKVDFLKIDVEGAEYRVINDARDNLKNVENIFVEYHGHTGSKQILHDILAVLTKSGFRYHLKEANPVAHPFLAEERGTLYDLQLNIFGFRQEAYG